MPHTILIARTRAEAQAWSNAQRKAGKRIAFAPTMGALHPGHVSLITRGLELADVAASSIFVNPTQFAANEDLSTYPRSEARDIEMLEAAGCGMVYCPTVADIYPPGDATRVTVKALSGTLEGEFRPTHFEGVATVVSRLFLHVAPDVAIFGEKDFQQLAVIRRMTLDFGFPIEIVGAPTLRETDGLAMSSRNAYLNAEQRVQAVALSKAMFAAIKAIEAGGSIRAATDAAKAAILAAGFDSIDYVEARVSETLAPFEGDVAEAGVADRLLIAARLGKTRLIDNAGFVRGV